MGPVLTCRRVKCFPKNASLSPDYAMMLVSHFQVWRNCAHKISKTNPIFWARKFCLINLKKIRSASFQSIRYNNERVTVNFKWKPTCNILISLNI